ncbi:MAG: LAGLIDADG family homing endonuclease [Nanoarchaeota archaeon]
MITIRPLDTGHLRLNYLKEFHNTNYTLRSHTELPNYDFPLFEGRHNSLKSFMQFRLTCPSPQNKNSTLNEGILTFDKSSGENKMKTDFALHFWDLSDRLRYKVEDIFMRFLFDKASGGDLKSLAEKLNVSYPFICQLRRGLYSIPSKLLIETAKIANEDLSVIEEHIEYSRTRHGNVSKINFPIVPSRAMASLVGHVFGDGYIGKKKRQFEYCNDNPSLLNEVRNYVREIFVLEPMTERRNRIGYSTIVGEVLELFGAHLAPKIYSNKTIPNWVKYGNSELKIAFIKALFDDDGSVMYSKNYNAKGINFYQIRDKSKLQSSHEFLSEVRELLKEFSIMAGKPHLRKFYRINGEEHAISYINVTDYKSILNFYYKIGLADGEKFNRLKKIIARVPENIRQLEEVKNKIEQT